MKIFDEIGNIITQPDLDKGRLVLDSRPIVHRYILIQEEKGHYETVAEYPNGGKIIEWIVDVPEDGVWKTYDANGEEIEWDGEIPDDTPHELDISDVEGFQRYIPFTDEEIQKKMNEEAWLLIHTQIADLRMQLSSNDSPIGDWKLIKCMEYEREGKEIPYDMEEYTVLRQAVRDEINRLEIELAAL